jgi:hypothetical protein
MTLGPDEKVFSLLGRLTLRQNKLRGADMIDNRVMFPSD